jgi:hypothetical protein
MLRASVLRENDLWFDPGFPHAEDYDFFDRLDNLSKLANFQRSLYQIRLHADSVSRLYSEVRKVNSAVSRPEYSKILASWSAPATLKWYNGSSIRIIVGSITFRARGCAKLLPSPSRPTVRPGIWTPNTWVANCTADTCICVTSYH